MKYKSFIILAVTLCFLQACTEPEKKPLIKPVNPGKYITTVYSKKIIPIDEYNNNKGYWENGELITDFDCQDDVKDFPPINIKLWDKVPAVSGRLPSYEETKNGTAICHYGEKNTDVKPYNMTLPKLATYTNYITKAKVIVVVIQIAQTRSDTVVSFRYLTGGCGGNTFSHFRFLTDEEVKKVTQ